jgi:hypothetical protein
MVPTLLPRQSSHRSTRNNLLGPTHTHFARAYILCRYCVLQMVQVGISGMCQGSLLSPLSMYSNMADEVVECIVQREEREGAAV